jgi:ferritin-like metal-binding protein YciE
MKTINTLEDALTMELENLYCSELRLLRNFAKLDSIIHSDELHHILRRYTENSNNRKVKLTRALSFFGHEPQACSVNVIDELVEESFNRLRFAQDADVQEQMLINCMERIVSYKICVYEAALRYAEELALETVADLLATMLEWERKAKRELVDLSVHIFSIKEFMADV